MRAELRENLQPINYMGKYIQQTQDYQEDENMVSWLTYSKSVKIYQKANLFKSVFSSRARERHIILDFLQTIL